MSDPVEVPEPRDLPLTRLLPNMLTLLALCSGLTAIRFALDGKWSEAALAIVVASVFDILDGRVARLLNMTSKFGAELDSLSDVISFGVAPGIVLYLWALHQGGGIGWLAVLLFAVCSALRLARFNTMLEDHTAPAWTKSYFTGIPAPAGAGLALLPLFYALEFGKDLQPPPALLALWVILMGGLMVSRVPTLALKGRRVAPIWVAPILVGTGLLIAALFTNPWLTLSGIGTVYFLCLPYGWYSYQRRMQKDAEEIDYAPSEKSNP